MRIWKSVKVKIKLFFGKVLALFISIPRGFFLFTILFSSLNLIPLLSLVEAYPAPATSLAYDPNMANGWVDTGNVNFEFDQPQYPSTGGVVPTYCTSGWNSQVWYPGTQYPNRGGQWTASEMAQVINDPLTNQPVMYFTNGSDRTTTDLGTNCQNTAIRPLGCDSGNCHDHKITGRLAWNSTYNSGITGAGIGQWRIMDNVTKSSTVGACLPKSGGCYRPPVRFSLLDYTGTLYARDAQTGLTTTFYSVQNDANGMNFYYLDYYDFKVTYVPFTTSTMCAGKPGFYFATMKGMKDSGSGSGANSIYGGYFVSFSCDGYDFYRYQTPAFGKVASSATAALGEIDSMTPFWDKNTNSLKIIFSALDNSKSGVYVASYTPTTTFNADPWNLSNINYFINWNLGVYQLGAWGYDGGNHWGNIRATPLISKSVDNQLFGSDVIYDTSTGQNNYKLVTTFYNGIYGTAGVAGRIGLWQLNSLNPAAAITVTDLTQNASNIGLGATCLNSSQFGGCRTDNPATGVSSRVNTQGRHDPGAPTLYLSSDGILGIYHSAAAGVHLLLKTENNGVAPLGTISATNSQGTPYQGHSGSGGQNQPLTVYAGSTATINARVTDANTNLGAPATNSFGVPLGYVGDIRKGELSAGTITAGTISTPVFATTNGASGSVNCTAGGNTLGNCSLSTTFSPVAADVGHTFIFWVRGFDNANLACNGNYISVPLGPVPGTTPGISSRCDSLNANDPTLYDEDFVLINVVSPPPWFMVTGATAHSENRFQNTVNYPALPNPNNNPPSGTALSFSNYVVTAKPPNLSPPGGVNMVAFYKSATGLDGITSYKTNISQKYTDNNVGGNSYTSNISNFIGDTSHSINSPKVRCVDLANQSNSPTCTIDSQKSWPAGSAFSGPDLSQNISIQLSQLPGKVNPTDTANGVIYRLVNTTGYNLVINYDLDGNTNYKKGIIIYVESGIGTVTINNFNLTVSAANKESSVMVITDKDINVILRNTGATKNIFSLGLVSMGNIVYTCLGGGKCDTTQNGFSFAQKKVNINYTNPDPSTGPALKMNFIPNYLVDIQSLFKNTNVRQDFIGFNF